MVQEQGEWLPLICRQLFQGELCLPSCSWGQNQKTEQDRHHLISWGWRSVLWEEDGGLGEVSRRRLNALLLSSALGAGYWLLLSTKATHQRGIFCFPLAVTLDIKAAAKGPCPGAGTAGIILQGQEGRAEAEGQGRSAPGMHNLESLEWAKGLLLGPSSPPAGNLSCTLGDPGNRLTATWSNGQLTASVLGLVSRGSKEPRAPYPRMWPCCVQFVTMMSQHVCGFLCNEKLHSDSEQGDSSQSGTRKVKTLSRFCLWKACVHLFQYRYKTMWSHNAKFYKALRSPQQCSLLCHWLIQLNSPFTPTTKVSVDLLSWWRCTPQQHSWETARPTVWLWLSPVVPAVVIQTVTYSGCSPSSTCSPTVSLRKLCGNEGERDPRVRTQTRASNESYWRILSSPIWCDPVSLLCHWFSCSFPVQHK